MIKTFVHEIDLRTGQTSWSTAVGSAR